MFVHNKVFSQWRLLKQYARSYFLCHTFNFIDDEEFLVLSDCFEWKNPCFLQGDYSTFNLNKMTESKCLSGFRFGKRDIPMQ